MEKLKATIYIKRLEALALFLQRWELIEQMYHEKREYYCLEEGTGTLHYHWVIKQFPRIFSTQWRMNENDRPYLEAMPNLNSLGAAAHYFNLKGDELFALFVPGHAYHPYNLRSMPDTARPGTLAHQIYSFMIQKQRELDETLKKFKQNGKQVL
jgi:hypothetical protein